MRKLVFGVSDQGLYSHKRWLNRREISDLGSRRIVYRCSENKGADQLRGNREADLGLCFRIHKKPVFPR